jgi:hypothetical protein
VHLEHFREIKKDVPEADFASVSRQRYRLSAKGSNHCLIKELQATSKPDTF